MTEEVLQEIKKDYEKRKEEREYLSKLLEEVIILEEDENVKKYLRLKEELSKVNYQKILAESDTQLLDSSFYSHRYKMKTTEVRWYIWNEHFSTGRCCC